MPVISSEIRLMRSVVISDAAGNGGRLGTTESVSGAMRNLFPDAFLSERVAGSTKYRKLFVKVANAANLPLANAMLFFAGITPGDDYIHFFTGTQVDTQGDISSPTLYGAGVLNAGVSAGATSIEVLVENWSAGVIFRNGDTILIKDSVNEEIATISGAPGVSGNIITLALAAPIGNNYSSGVTSVGSGLSLGTIVGAFSNWIETAAVSGAYAEGTTGNVVVGSIGGVFQDWTLTFTSATAFTLSGNTLGSVGSGAIGSNFSPNNPDFSAPYFTILAAGWSGTWQAGDTVTFRTTPAAAPVWYRRIIPAGAAAISNNGLTQRIVGETA